MAKAGRGAEQVMVRLPDGMRETLKEIAADNGRSMNAEIVERLTSSMQWPMISLPQDLYDKVVELPVGILSELEREIKNDIERRVSEAIYNHNLSQSNFLTLFEMLVEYAPAEEKPHLRKQILDLLIRAGANDEHTKMFRRDD